MKILIVTQRYNPENFRINEISFEMKKNRNKVTVLTGLPNCVCGQVPSKYKHHKNRHEIINGIEVYRCTEIPRSNSTISRLINYYSFMFFSRRKIMKIGHDYDVILFNELSPIMSGSACVKYKKKYGTKLLMYHMDLWPNSLTAGGIKESSLIYKYYRHVSSKIYRYFDKILVSTKEHAACIKSLKHCENLDIEYLPQFAEEYFDCKPVLLENEKDVYHVAFAGNLGYAQSLDTILKTAQLLKDNKKFVFDIYGNGILYEYLRDEVQTMNLDNLVLHGEVPSTDMPKYYAMSDIMLVTLEDKSYANKTIPGKVQTYMAAGKPVFGAINGSTQNLVNHSKCGVCVKSGDYKALASELTMVNYSKLNEYALNSYKYYCSNFKKNNFIDKLNQELENLI